MTPEDRAAIEARLAAAEQVCLMVGWGAADNSERGKARHELWRTWFALYREAGGSPDPTDHPELDARIAELAAQRDRIVAETMQRLAPTEPEAERA